MARPQESFSKKDLEKRKMQKRKEKEQRKEERKANPKQDTSLESMLAYVDENGNLTNKPPDLTVKKTSINTADIVTGSRNTGETPHVKSRQGKVMFFNYAKGFGFIKDSETGKNVFVSSNVLLSTIKDNDMVSFETEQGPKGLNAIKVRLLR